MVENQDSDTTTGATCKSGATVRGRPRRLAFTGTTIVALALGASAFVAPPGVAAAKRAAPTAAVTKLPSKTVIVRPLTTAPGEVVTFLVGGLRPANGVVDFLIGDVGVGTVSVSSSGVAQLRGPVYLAGSHVVTARWTRYSKGRRIVKVFRARNASARLDIGVPPTTVPIVVPTPPAPATASPVLPPPDPSAPTVLLGPGSLLGTRPVVVGASQVGARLVCDSPASSAAVIRWTDPRGATVAPAADGSFTVQPNDAGGAVSCAVASADGSAVSSFPLPLLNGTGPLASAAAKVVRNTDGTTGCVVQTTGSVVGHRFVRTVSGVRTVIDAPPADVAGLTCEAFVANANGVRLVVSPAA